jgi:hypothetical protein
MRASDWVVTRLPITELRTKEGIPVGAERVRDLDREHTGKLIREGPVQFVVTDVGAPLTWIAPSRCYEFWKREVQPHLYDETRPRLENYPDEYFYFASEWRLESGDRTVVLETVH